MRADFISASLRAAQSGAVGKHGTYTVAGQSPKMEDTSRNRTDLQVEREFTGEIRMRIEEIVGTSNLWLQVLVG